MRGYSNNVCQSQYMVPYDNYSLWAPCWVHGTLSREAVMVIRELLHSVRVIAWAVALAVVAMLPGLARAGGPILQYYESPYAETTDRIADVFMAGYGALWLPPIGKAEGGPAVCAAVLRPVYVSG